MVVSVFTLGCKTNLYESGQIVTALCQAGHDAFLGLKRADVFVLNTCAITQEAEKKSRQLVARARKLNPDCRVIVVGCASQKNQSQFDGIANVTYVCGVADKTSVVRHLLDSGVDVQAVPSSYAETVFATQERTRSFVKIQDGCNNFCSYCIVPYLRGRSRSRKIADVVQEVKACNSAEVVLIGIDISQFGKDTGESLPQLFNAIADAGVTARLRFGSLEESVVTDELLTALQRVNFCPHFHLSLQSGCDATLKRMNRKYTTAQYAAAVDKIRSYFPLAAITTDIIVGFCGETDEEFAQTCNFAEQIAFADVHVFPYSPRKGTVAYGWQDVDPHTKTARAKKLGEVKLALKSAFDGKFVGTCQSVLVEENKKGFWQGYTPQYVRVYVKDDGTFAKSLPQEPVNQLLSQADGGTCNDGCQVAKGISAQSASQGKPCLSGRVVQVKLVGLYKDGLLGELI